MKAVDRRSLAALAPMLLMAACSGTPAPTATVTAGTTAPSPPSAQSDAPASPSMSPDSIPDVVVVATDDLAAGLPYSCLGRPFDIGVLYGPPNGFDQDYPSADSFGLGEVGTLLSVDDWWLTYRTATEAEFVGPSTTAYAYVRLELTDDGTWTPTTYGGCLIRYAEVGIDATAWRIGEGSWPSDRAREVVVEARDACPKSLPDRLRDPIVRYGPDAILMILLADDPAPGADCGSGQIARLPISLDEEAGDRAFVDGGVWPARDAHEPTPELGSTGGEAQPL